MARWIALLRGVNVGGANVLPMKRLATELAASKLENVRTYLQSGNVVFDSRSKSASSLAASIRETIEREHGFAPQVLVLSPTELQAAIDANPFREAVSEPTALHFFFLERPPASPNVAALDAATSPTERYLIADRVFYLHAPDGVGRSKLASTAEKSLGVAATARNFRTVEKLSALAAE